MPMDESSLYKECLSNMRLRYRNIYFTQKKQTFLLADHNVVLFQHIHHYNNLLQLDWYGN